MQPRFQQKINYVVSYGREWINEKNMEEEHFIGFSEEDITLTEEEKNLCKKKKDLRKHSTVYSNYKACKNTIGNRYINGLHKEWSDCFWWNGEIYCV